LLKDDGIQICAGISHDDVKDIPVPIPKNERVLADLHSKVREMTDLRERAARLDSETRDTLASLFGKLARNGGPSERVRRGRIELAGSEQTTID